MIVLKATGLPVGSRVIALALLMLSAVVLVIGGMLVVGARPADAATTLTVNKTGDAGDRKINGVCDSSRKRGKQCTLRAAIQESNGIAGAGTINFKIGGTASVKTISPASALPEITDSVTINGYSQGSQTATTSDDARENTLAEDNNAVLKIQLNGANAGSDTNGLTIRDAAESTIKGLAINRFGGDGVRMSGFGAAGNEVQGNFIGTNALGTEALGNASGGVLLLGAPNNTIGGTTTGARNVISGNDDDGVGILGNGSSEVEGNFIGTTASGSEDLGNSDNGVFIDDSALNTVGGTASGARNVISGNGGDGIQIRGLRTTRNKVEGNLVGTTVGGDAALGNSGEGVEISGADDNTIGGTTAGVRNVISGNGGDGIVLFGTDASGNEVLGNFIGTDANGTTALGNDDGVVISSANNSAIGGATAAAGNRIANNDQDGVLVFGGAAVVNSVLSNAIFSNGELGIDLGTEGVTPNDTDDPDASSSNNRLQNFPIITSATRSTTTGFTTISGALNSDPSQPFTVQCFVAAPDASGHGEGQIPAAQTTVDTDSGGDDSFSCVSPVPQPGQAVTATATNTATGDTSEFSQNVGVVSGP